MTSNIPKKEKREAERAVTQCYKWFKRKLQKLTIPRQAVASLRVAKLRGKNQTAELDW